MTERAARLLYRGILRSVQKVESRAPAALPLIQREVTGLVPSEGTLGSLLLNKNFRASPVRFHFLSFSSFSLFLVFK